GVLVVVPDVELTVIIQMAGITNVDENGQVYNTEPIIGSTGGRARSDGKIQSGDVITSLMIDNDTHVIESWDDVIAFFKIHKRGDLTLTYMRDGTEGVANYALISESALTKLGYQALIFQIGISPDSEFDWATTLKYPFVSIYNNTHQVFTTLGLLFNPSEKLGISDLAGPVGIFTLVSSTRSQGILALIGFTAFLSINIGLLNLLPIPALDGGRLIFLGIEALTRKPLNRKVENTINNVMFFMLLGLFVFVTYNDILRIFRG
ncbi:MAG: site-2 protease family protein, partial [Acholeplasmataceae bacterium]|nr:site-2 protease family protein [Acholeplasmataceae bacterium]